MSGSAGDISSFISQHYLLAYVVFYLTVLFFGSIPEFTGFWAAFKGFFGREGLLLIPCIIILASMSSDLLWYSLGRTLRETRFGRWVKRTLPGHKRAEEHLEKNGMHWIFAARFIYASAFPILFSIGWSRMEFKKFIRTSLLSNLVWTPFLMGIAYLLVLTLSPLESVAVFEKFEIAFVIGVAGFLILNYFAIKAMRQFIRPSPKEA